MDIFTCIKLSVNPNFMSSILSSLKCNEISDQNPLVYQVTDLHSQVAGPVSYVAWIRCLLVQELFSIYNHTINM